MVTYNDKILVPNATKDGLDTIHPETNTGNVYDFKNNKWLNELLDVASTTDLGLVRVDGTSITIDSNGVLKGASTYELPTSSTTVLGGVKVDNSSIKIDETGTISAEIPVIQDASITQKGVVQLNDTLTSTSIIRAATANAIKQVNDKIPTDSGWINLAPNTGWVVQNTTARNLRYRKIGDFIYVRFSLLSLSNLQALLFTMPTGYRPTGQVPLPVFAPSLTDGIKMGYVNVNGTVMLVNTTGISSNESIYGEFYYSVT